MLPFPPFFVRVKTEVVSDYGQDAWDAAVKAAWGWGVSVCWILGSNGGRKGRRKTKKVKRREDLKPTKKAVKAEGGDVDAVVKGTKGREETAIERAKREAREAVANRVDERVGKLKGH